MSYRGRAGYSKRGANRGRGGSQGRGGTRGRGSSRARGGSRGRGGGTYSSSYRGRGGYQQQSQDYYGSYGDYYGYYADYYQQYYDYYNEKGEKSQKAGPYYEKNQFNYVKDKQIKKEEEKKVVDIKSFVHQKSKVEETLYNVGRNKTLSILMVTEKPSIAKTISDILSKGTATESRGEIKSCAVWQYDGDFKGYKATFKVTSVAGHMYSRDFSEKVDTWKVDPKLLFDEETIQQPTSKGLCKHIQMTGKNIDFLLLWLDCDKEGENI